MSEIRINEVFLAGRLTQRPVQTEDDRVHFLLEASSDPKPFHCLCEEKTAMNLLQYCGAGDELSVEGDLRWVDFPNTGKTLVIYGRHLSYGRKSRTLRR